MTCRPCVVLLLAAAAVLAGCVPATPSPPTPPAPPPASMPRIAALCGPKPFGAEQPPEAWVRFEVTRQQLQVIDGRLLEVLCRQGLWRQGVGFGFNYEGSGAFVMIHPGRSGLTARQILDRLLGRRP